MLPALPDVETVRERLQVIFPEGTPQRTRCTSLAAARTIFTMLYVGAVEGGEWLAPKFVYRMGSRQAAETSDAARVAYLAAFKKSVASLAWGSFAWCFSEPDHLIAFDGATPWAIRSLRYFGGGGPGR